METFYLIVVCALFILAISDLVVGVSNDAVNFLNSAVGSKAAPFRIIMVVAAVGVFVGASFSSGMMEVARQGIFHPSQFYFSEIMIIFLAVMITDVILLDFYNTYGLPTSTTVSIVFELLGAAVAISILKIIANSESINNLSTYINSAKALAIISAILISVAVALTAGVIIQYITRLIFSFDYEKRIKRFGGIWGGIGITFIIYFLLVKGAGGAAFMSDGLKQLIQDNTQMIIVGNFIFWSILLQLIASFTRLNILKFIVLAGTFALAMAFAGNDLVNFIGVPLAGYESYKDFIANPGIDPDSLRMGSLAEPIVTSPLFLIAAGLIMVVTLWTSKKAHSVIRTEVDLGRQEEGYERFGSSIFSRLVVRSTVSLVKGFDSFFSERFRKRVGKNFDLSPFQKRQKELGVNAPSFDLLRASVTLIIASALISFATSLKLPLSTTYVTFMVAMGTSLADRAWGRESAVYRITGVISVIGGWFLTALAAFTVAFGFAMAIYFGGMYAIIGLILVAIFFISRTHIIHRKRDVRIKEREGVRKIEVFTGQRIMLKCSNEVVQILKKVSEIYGLIVRGLAEENTKTLRNAQSETSKINKETKQLKNNLNITISKLEDSLIETGLYYVQMIDYLREIAHSVNFIVKPCFDHVANNHKNLLPSQVDELQDISRMLVDFVGAINKLIREHQTDKLTDISLEQGKIIKYIDTCRKKQVKRIKLNEVGTRNSLLYFNILSESKNLMLQLINLIKAHRDFTDIVNGVPLPETPPSTIEKS
jgi:phosphate/sulfate permease